MTEIYIVALMTGLVGSLHCIGMCGPIAIALPLGKKNWLHRTFGSLTYNVGRTLTYGVLGALFGLLGQGIELAGLQQWATILIGVIMIISVLFPVVFRQKIKIDQIFTGYAGRLIGQFKKLFTKSSYSSLFVIGLLNGLLPCGLVYVAIAGAISSGSVITGITYMILFGLGTIPVMLAIPIAGNMLGAEIRKKFRGAVSAFILILGILFILRGLSLGIPYISPPTKVLQPHEKTMMKKDGNVNNDDSIPSCH